MTQPAKSQEPSMEEILASIRRIIADDDATKSTQKPAEAAAPAASPARPEPSPRLPNPAPRVPDPNLSANPEPAEPEGGAAGEQSADILDLTESMASPMSPPQPSEPHPMPAPAPAFRTIDGSFDVSYEEHAEKLAPTRHFSEPPTQLLSGATSAAVDSAFNTLAQTVLVQNARTLEVLVREMLRPMLKSWLDDNLPGLVERLVRAEIERVSRGRMG
jgi:hypothetical protein